MGASGYEISYSIPDGFDIGTYTYTVNFTDDYGKTITDSVTFTVEEIKGIIGPSFEIVLTMFIGTIAAIIKIKKTRINQLWNKPLNTK